MSSGFILDPPVSVSVGLLQSKANFLGVDWLISTIARSHDRLCFIKQASSVLTRGEVCGCDADFPLSGHECDLFPYIVLLLLQCQFCIFYPEKSESVSHSVMSNSLQPHGL